ncbi:CpsD/CapB family tyrosine-protein kinase [Enterococcus asini]|uniref:CpsD/CapB family tyrosine-protein kinase n=1 Tax=Enterococcus asini TaxID=57732 RepID=UPI00288DE69C|nr:CpsD/CapB family tyrosine-protein kinase [Enterococcus asini]MDT2757479.1 CpsD/CapB family tyrosine-protein kinase [Enterococcus asini]
MGKSKKQHNHRTTQVTGAVSLITIADKTSPIAEQYRTIRTNIQFASADRKIQTIVVTSSGPSEGKSITAANIAVVFANAGQRVLLVDADMRKPTVHKTFALSNEAGLSKVLSSNNSVLEMAQPSMVDNLSILTSGPKPPNPSELLGSTRMNQVIDEARHLYDVIIFDMPPVVTVTDAQIMASKADGTLLVVRENVTRKDALTKAKDLLEMVQARVLGVVYNGTKDVKDRSYYYYSND